MSAPITPDLGHLVTPPTVEVHRSTTVPDGDSHLIHGVRVFTALTALGAVACLALSVHQHRWPYALGAATLTVLTAVGGAVICLHSELADRREFYRRGQLDGWLRGWRGQEPEVDDPNWYC